MSFLSNEGDDDCCFYDTREDISSISDSGSDCGGDNNNNNVRNDKVYWVSSSSLWSSNLESVDERRDKFLKWLGMSSDQSVVDRTREDSGTVLANSDSGMNSDSGGGMVCLSSTRSSGSCSSSSDSWGSCEGETETVEVNLCYRIKNLDNGTEFIVDQLGNDGMLSRLREVGSNRLLSVEEFHNSLGLTPLIHQFVRREDGADAEERVSVEVTKRVKTGWLKKLGIVACIVDRQHENGSVKHHGSVSRGVSRVQRVKVHASKKRLKELSALYAGQDIQAHEGSILTMKFSPDGCYLASAGEDRVVRVWEVIERDRSKDVNATNLDPSNLYFKGNRYSEIAYLSSNKEKMQKHRAVRRTSDSSCAIFPPKIFRLSEKPIHEFHGHNGEILDLSWSNNKCLLSSSVDKTVRLWKVGCDQCLKTFSHNNYVTCIQFNPVDDNYFISGSIDGKVRIWNVPDCHVVDWTDIKDIVTAVCYSPDAKGAIVGSMTGNCRFYHVTDNRLQLDAQICLQGKKKSPGKRITGFQFFPSDPRKVMVTSADSHVRILSGMHVICKYKGFRNTGSQISASFTKDGKHIVSASEDSTVHVWNNKSPDSHAPSRAKSITSREHFSSCNVSVATPWCGMRDHSNIVIPTLADKGWHHYHSNDPRKTLPLSATWPEENLPRSNNLPVPPSVASKTQYKFLKSFNQNTPSHAWGLVIVTGGWDGRIHAFHNYGLPVHT